MKADGAVEIERGSAEAGKVVAYVKSAFDSSEAAEVARLAAAPAANDLPAAGGFPYPLLAMWKDGSGACRDVFPDPMAGCYPDAPRL